jgi:hypothetical protein
MPSSICHLSIVMPTPYRPPGARKLKYDQPAYLITTDLITSAQALIQAQVWSDKSVPRLHPALVAAYALLKLAANLPPMICSPAFEPIWQPKSTRSPQMGPSILGKLSPPPNAVGKRPRGWCRIAG